MECHEVRVLLALTRRGDAIDPTERAALQQHLDACPDCAAHSQSEQVVDAALGSAMRAVAVPAGLQARLLTRLTASRPRRWPKVAAAAAAVLLAVGIASSIWWAVHRPTPIDTYIASMEITGRHSISPVEVQQWYAERGIEMETWHQIDHQYLWTFDIVEFRGRRVPKLIFYRDDRNAIAQVLVLRTKEFDTHDLQDDINGQSLKITVRREQNSDYVFVVASNAEGAFLLPPQ
jgi:anti-sigma factor (TIGR02949 family)